MLTHRGPGQGMDRGRGQGRDRGRGQGMDRGRGQGMDRGHVWYPGQLGSLEEHNHGSWPNVDQPTKKLNKSDWN